MTALEMYLFTRVDKILMVSGLASVIFGFASALSLIMFIITSCDELYSSTSETAGTKLACLVSIPVLLISLSMYLLVPSQKELAAIMIVPKILSSENVDNLTKIGANGINIMKLATDYTKEILEEKVKK